MERNSKPELLGAHPRPFCEMTCFNYKGLKKCSKATVLSYEDNKYMNKMVEGNLLMLW